MIPVPGPVRGYAALLSTLVICAGLTVLAYQASASLFTARLQIVEEEYKQRSRELAYSCLNAALYQLASDLSYRPDTAGDEVWMDSAHTCTIESVREHGGSLSVRLHAEVENSYTVLEAELMLRPATGKAPFLLRTFREI